MLDLIIRNGTIVDGTGLPRFAGDVGVQGGRLASVGRRLDDVDVGDGDRRRRAGGGARVPTHTPTTTPSCASTRTPSRHRARRDVVVTGNCSLSLAPLRPAHRERFSRMFRLIEEMPRPPSTSGWTGGGASPSTGWLDALRADLALNLAPLVGHWCCACTSWGAIPAGRRRRARCAAMADLLRGCLEAGAVGLSTSYVDVEDDLRPVPCRWAEHGELEALCAVLAEHGADAADRARVLRSRPHREPGRGARRPFPPLRHPDHVLAAVPLRGHARGL